MIYDYIRFRVMVLYLAEWKGIRTDKDYCDLHEVESPRDGVAEGTCNDAGDNEDRTESDVGCTDYGSQIARRWISFSKDAIPNLRRSSSISAPTLPWCHLGDQISGPQAVQDEGHFLAGSVDMRGMAIHGIIFFLSA